MEIVDLKNLELSFGGGHPGLKGTPHYTEPEILAFADSLGLLLHLAADGARQTEIQSQIQRRLKDDPVANQWHGQRAKIKDLPHFGKYRKSSHYEAYHDAARAVSRGDQTPAQQAMRDGLNAEIAASALLLPKDQVVFHGRADLDLSASSTYPSFISTSLDPTVAVYHARKRGSKSGTHPVVYMLTVAAPTHAIWGNGGGLEEWELLLGAGLTCAHVQTYPGERFDVVEATIQP